LPAGDAGHIARRLAALQKLLDLRMPQGHDSSKQSGSVSTELDIGRVGVAAHSGREDFNMARKLLYIIGGIVVVLVLLGLILPFVIDANKFRPQIESAADSALNRKLTIGNIRLALFSGGVSIDDLSISEDPAFGSHAFLTAKSLTVGVEILPLIFSRELRVTGITIDQPHITMLRSPSGVWNFSSLGATSSSSKPPVAASSSVATASSAPQNVFVQKIEVNNGTLSVGKTNSTKRNEYTDVNLEASGLSYTSQFPFTLAARTPGNGTLKLNGKTGPINQSNAAMTPVDASIEVHNFDLTSTGFMDPSSGIAGLLDFTGTLSSDGRRLSSKGTVSANKLKLVPRGSPANKEVKVDYATEYQMQPETGTLNQGDLRIGKAVAHLTGTYNNSGETASVAMKLNGENMPAPDLAAVLPAVGVTLPAGASLKEGTLDVSLSIRGPVDRLVTSGPIKLSNAKLAGFNLGEKMSVLSSFAGIPKGSDTVIETFSSDVRVAPDGIRSDNLKLVAPAIGSLTGNGTVAPNQALDFKMIAHLSSSNSPLGRLAGMASIGGGQKGSAGGIPFKIQGTTSNPVFIPDVAGIASGLGKGATPGVPTGVQDLGKQLGGLFGGKK
jgi:AsmA protein